MYPDPSGADSRPMRAVSATRTQPPHLINVLWFFDGHHSVFVAHRDMATMARRASASLEPPRAWIVNCDLELPPRYPRRKAFRRPGHTPWAAFPHGEQSAWRPFASKGSPPVIGDDGPSECADDTRRDGGVVDRRGLENRSVERLALPPEAKPRA
jgi:hypothetical protein